MSYKNKKNSLEKKLLVALGILLVAAGIFAVLELTGTTHVFKKKTYVPPQTIGQENKGEQASQPSTDSNGTTGQTGSSEPSTKHEVVTSVIKDLQAPSGNFVSNHSPSLSGRTTPNTENSVCVTSPGATCTIVFTKGTAVISLPAQTTDNEGATYWSWDINKLGLGAGSWIIQGKASYQKQVKTTTDALKLEVAQ